MHLLRTAEGAIDVLDDRFRHFAKGDPFDGGGGQLLGAENRPVDRCEFRSVRKGPTRPSKRHRYPVMFLTVGLALFLSGATQASNHEYYRGKTVRFVVGFGAGGGFDTYTRTIARHIGNHLPGKPLVIVDNMTGAGSLVAANYIYRVAKPDGLTVGNFISGLLLQQILGSPGVEFDGPKFEFIGIGAKYIPVCFFTKASGITSMEKWFAAQKPAKLGGTGPGSSTDDIPKILQPYLGLPIQLVSGYRAFPDVQIAADSGEVDGACFGWDTLKSRWEKKIKSGDVVIVLQTVDKPHPDLPQVPLAVSYAKTDEARRVIQAGIHDLNSILRLYALPPRTPGDIVRAVRTAFLETMKDPDFLADAKKSKLDVDPLSGEEVQKIVAGLFDLEPSLKARLKELLSVK